MGSRKRERVSANAKSSAELANVFAFQAIIRALRGVKRSDGAVGDFINPAEVFISAVTRSARENNFCGRRAEIRRRGSSLHVAKALPTLSAP